MKYLIGFVFSTLVFIFQKAAHPLVFFNAFVPMLGVSILSLNKEKALWIAFASGLLVDFFASTKMGIWPLNFCLCSLVLFRFKSHFYKDKFQHVGMFAAIFSSLSSILHAFISFLFDSRIPFSGKWLITDCVIMPIIDGVYTIVWFFISFWLYDQAKSKLFLLKAKLKLRKR